MTTRLVVLHSGFELESGFLSILAGFGLRLGLETAGIGLGLGLGLGLI